MRLTCPNCKAQYEVEESVIPEGGREVQCSACGNTWYQYPISVALQMRAAELDDDDDDDDDEDEGSAGVPPPPGRQIDRSVMDLLRDEAERELRERRGGGAAGGLETQPDLGLPQRRARQEARPESRDRAGAASAAASAAAAAARRTGSAGARPAVAESNGDSDRDAASRSRLEMLPDIEELSSTLQPRREPRRPAVADTGEEGEVVEERRGLVRGLSMVVIVVAVLLGLYLFSPVIAANVPALESAMIGYVALVDALRLVVAGWIDSLRGIVGGG